MSRKLWGRGSVRVGTLVAALVVASAGCASDDAVGVGVGPSPDRDAGVEADAPGADGGGQDVADEEVAEPEPAPEPEPTPEPAPEPEPEPEVQEPCLSPRACEAPEVCRAERGGGGLDFVCDDVDEGLAALGEPCDGDGDCRSALCVQGRCSGPCVEAEDCSAEVPLDCALIEIPVGDQIVERGVCLGPPACERDGGCEPGLICRLERGRDVLHAFCGAALEPGLPAGALCEEDGACATGLCQSGVCGQACVGDEDCDGGLVCQRRVVELEGRNVEAQLCGALPEDACGNDADCAGQERCVARRRPDRIDFVCGALNEGGVGQGQGCEQDAQCSRGLCEQGACAEPCRLAGDCGPGLLCADVEVAVELGTATARVCAAPEPCESPGQCGVGQTCFVRAVGVEDVEAVCLPPNRGGRPLATGCAQDSECAANLCLRDFLSVACSHPCAQDGDCPAPGYRCAIRSLRGSEASRRSVCVPPDPVACVNNAGCQGGLRCSIVPNRGGTALTSVCRVAPGPGLPGAACEADGGCASGLCLSGFCSAPCQGRQDCGPDQICEAIEIEREGLSGSFDVCRTLPDVVCQSNEQCSEGGRVCGLIDFEDPVALHCAFPQEDGGALGASCEGRLSPNDQCLDRLCLRGITDECTRACVDGADCQGGPGGYICTEFGFQGGTLRMCADGCSRDGDCGREAQNCGLIRNVGDDRFEFICRSPLGVDPPGTDCSGQIGCDHGLCLIRGGARTCTLPCEQDADCPSAMPECGDATIARPRTGESQTLRVCTPP